MFKKQDFKKLDLLGSGKKHTKIYKVQHITNGKIFALKEIEAKNLEKLNEYKEEAVQLSKVQNHPNIIKFYGYYFYETMYNTFRLGLVTEFMDNINNLENVYRRRKKTNQFWKESELITFVFSVISTCSYLQQRGICHRDIKPANIFIQPNSEAKLIDFGESKDYFFDIADENRVTYTMATIRGTPQYLSPILWKAHVIDGNSRYAKHNIYKSDVFSTGLLVYQMAGLREVTSFNNKTVNNDGEEIIKQSLAELERMYSPNFVSILSIMLIFEESSRPSFLEMEYLFIEHENKENSIARITTTSSSTLHKTNENTVEGDKLTANDYIKYYNKHYNTLLKKNSFEVGDSLLNGNNKMMAKASLNLSMNAPTNSISQNKISLNESKIMDMVSNNTPNQSTNDISSNKVKRSSNNMKQLSDNNILKDSSRTKLAGTPPKNNTNATSSNSSQKSSYWFEFGGKTIGKYNIIKNKWKITINHDDEVLPYHFISIYITNLNVYYLLGGPKNEQFKIFKNPREKLIKGKNMNTFRNFFTAALTNDKVYVFGGYDDITKKQIKKCEYYDIKKDSWNDINDMTFERSQLASCSLDDDCIYLFGGFNKEKGTLDAIEQYSIKDDRFKILDVKLPEPLRRFNVMKCPNNIFLIMGGLKKFSQVSQSVFKYDVDKKIINEWENLEKGGVLESELILDHEGCCHLFLEDSNGTSPPSHIRYFFDEKMSKYVTNLGQND